MKTINAVLLAIACSTLAAPALASNAKAPGKGEICHERSKNNACANAHKPKKNPAHEVPEIDTAGAGLALALMAGMVAVRRERRNGKQK